MSAATNFDPYYKWLGIPPEDQPPTHYRLLGLRPFESDADVIQSAADQRMVHVRTYQTGTHSNLSQQLLNELAAARVCLLRPDRKVAYDAELRAKLKPQPVVPPPTRGAGVAVPRGTPVPAQVPETGGLELDLQLSGTRRRHRRSSKNASNAAAWLTLFLVVALPLALGGIWILVKSRPHPTTAQPPQPSTNTKATSPVAEKALDRPVAQFVPPSQPAEKTRPNSRPIMKPPRVIEQSNPPQPAMANPAGNEIGSSAAPTSTVDPAAPSAVISVTPENPTAATNPPGANEGNPTNPVAEVVRAAVPSDSEQAEAKKLLLEIYGTDLSNAKSSEEKLAVADTLVAQSENTKNMVERFVLLTEAKRLSQEAVDLPRSLATARKLAELYQVDVWTSVAETLEELSHTATTNLQRRPIAETALEEAENAELADQYEAARKILQSGLGVARRVSDPRLLVQFNDRLRENTEGAKELERVTAAREKLAASPDDADANLIVGKYLCFTRDQWPDGLPLLIKSSEPKIVEAAKQELVSPAVAEEQSALADAWWDCAASADRSEKSTMLERAEFWYLKAMPQLEGLAQAKIQKRLDELTGLKSNSTVSGTTPVKSFAVLVRSTLPKVRNAIKTNSVNRSSVIGAEDPQWMFNDVPAAGGLLVGFNYSIQQGSNSVSTIQPIYVTAKGSYLGGAYGTSLPGVPGKVEAPKGYVVGGIEVFGQGYSRSFTLLYMKLTPSGLDTTDVQRSAIIGNANGAALSQTLCGDGKPIVGIFGCARPRSSLMGFGLIQTSE